MKFWTEEAVQEMADRKGKAICAWIPLINGNPIPSLGAFPWVIDPTGRVADYESNANDAYSIRRVFRPAKKT